MKFSEKYPNMCLIIEEAPNGIVRGYDKQPCWNCGALTEYIDINFEAPICSEECQAQKNDEYIQDCLQHMTEDGQYIE